MKLRRLFKMTVRASGHDLTVFIAAENLEEALTFAREAAKERVQRAFTTEAEGTIEVIEDVGLVAN